MASSTERFHEALIEDFWRRSGINYKSDEDWQHLRRIAREMPKIVDELYKAWQLRGGDQ